MNLRKASRVDLEEIVAMLSDDKLGEQREDFRIPLPTSYEDAFDNIKNDPNQYLMVVEIDEEIIGTFQLSFLQYLTYEGGLRAQIEAVRIKREYRGKGIGKKMFEWAISYAKDRGAHLVQLTSDKKRPEAIEFYEKLGFHASHFGCKLHFRSTDSS